MEVKKLNITIKKSRDIDSNNPPENVLEIIPENIT